MRNLIVITLVLTGLLSASATADAFGRRCRGTVVVSSCPTYYYSCPAYYYSCPTTVIEEVPVFAVSPYLVPQVATVPLTAYAGAPYGAPYQGVSYQNGYQNGSPGAPYQNGYQNGSPAAQQGAVSGLTAEEVMILRQLIQALKDRQQNPLKDQARYRP
jgi:hypothetical protein